MKSHYEYVSAFDTRERASEKVKKFYLLRFFKIKKMKTQFMLRDRGKRRGDGVCIQIWNERKMMRKNIAMYGMSYNIVC
jgi:hypothetical protein